MPGMRLGIKLLSFLYVDSICVTWTIFANAAGVPHEPYVIEPNKEERCTVDREDIGKCFLYLTHLMLFSDLSACKRCMLWLLNEGIRTWLPVCSLFVVLCALGWLLILCRQPSVLHISSSDMPVGTKFTTTYVGMVIE